ncbi:hypothetical protein YC2023_087439 [Brassica napus]
MYEKKLVFVSIASPNNLTPTSEKPLLYYGLSVLLWITIFGKGAKASRFEIYTQDED